MNNGKEGERLFAELMAAQGYNVSDVSGDFRYFSQDIDFFMTNTATGNTRSFEVKWDQNIHNTNNLFLEIKNPRSRQWGGEGWWPHCKADYLVYGDAVNRKFYCFPLLELRQRVDQLLLTTRTTRDMSTGLILPLCKVRDLAIVMEAVSF